MIGNLGYLTELLLELSKKIILVTTKTKREKLG